jgi:glycosyltransferase involved in cell wall biosynthesis
MFSVVVPVFNREPSAALKSVQAQTFRDFECILVDDGSENGDYLKALVAGLDSRFRYIRQDNQGGGVARNTGIDAAKMPYVAFLDSDDIWQPSKLERDLDLIRPNRVVFAPVVMKRGSVMAEVRPKRAPHPNEDISEYLIRRQGWTPMSTVVVPRSIASRFHPYPRFGQDTDFALRLFNEGLEFVMHPKASVIVIDDEGSRVSRSPDWTRAAVWLTEVRDLMTEKAYWAYRGWHIARLAAQSGNRKVALALYRQALIRGALPPKLALKALGQIVIPRRFYSLIR